ncbi:hypothetical protein [Citricoccus nitrophenolicus]|uniref:hypothetical protein n=1 Tax=Citricoccus nitrophenolicus TaxID=863575 RepID=UPI0031EEFF4B
MTHYLTASDAGYDAERSGYNLAVEHYPEVIIPAETVEDVVAAGRCSSPPRGWTA